MVAQGNRIVADFIVRHNIGFGVEHIGQSRSDIQIARVEHQHVFVLRAHLFYKGCTFGKAGFPVFGKRRSVVIVCVQNG